MIYRIDFKAMGCRMLAMVDSQTPAAADTLALVPGWFEEWEQALSRFRSDSELSLLNKAAGLPVRVSETLWSVFQAARDAEFASGGLVTATLLQALAAAGYDQSFERLSRDPRHLPISGWTATSSILEVAENARQRELVLPADMQLDFGGVAKGWAASESAARLAKHGPALVSAGGDIAISAPLRDGSPWAVNIDDPFHPGQYLYTLALGACGVATSGTDYRRWKQGSRWNHHIIDPRSGQPAQTDLIAVTIIAPDALQAEMAAKAVLIQGCNEGLKWLEKRQHLAALMVLETGEHILANNIDEFFWRS